MKYINMSIVYWFYNFFTSLKIKVAQISCSLGDIKGCREQWAEWGLGKPEDGYHSKQELPMVVGLMGCSPYGVEPSVCNVPGWTAGNPP